MGQFRFHEVDIEDRCAVTANIAWYDCSFCSASLQDAFEEAVACMASFGYTPNYIAFFKPNAKKSSRKAFKPKWLNEVGKVYEQMHSITVSCGAGPSRMDYFAEFDCDVGAKTASISVIATTPEKVYSLEPIMLKLASAFHCSYATAFVMPYFRLPLLYISGIGCDRKYDPEGRLLKCTWDEEGHRMSSWRIYGGPDKKYNEGYIRDVYALNLLNASQVHRELVFDQGGEKIKFLDWIRTQEGQTIVELGSDRWLWRVPHKDTFATRDKLMPTEMIFLREYVELREKRERLSPEEIESKYPLYAAILKVSNRWPPTYEDE